MVFLIIEPDIAPRDVLSLPFWNYTGTQIIDDTNLFWRLARIAANKPTINLRLWGDYW